MLLFKKPGEERTPGRLSQPLFSRNFLRIFHVSTTPRRLIAGGLFMLLLLVFTVLHTDTFFTDGMTKGPLLYGICLGLVVLLGGLTAFRWGVHERVSPYLCLLVAVLLPALTMTMVEFMNGELITDWSFQTLMLNYILYGLFYGLVYVCSGSIRLPIFIVTPLFFLLSLTNHWVSAHRGTPFIPLDFFALSTATKVMATYDFALDYQIVVSALLTVLVLVLGAKQRTPRMDLVAKIATRVFFATLIVAVTCIYFFTDEYAKVGLKPDFWNQNRGFHRTGVVMNFCLNTKYLYVTAPNGYDADGVEELVYEVVGEDHQSESTAPSKPQTPNIICIMNESLADLRVLGDVKTNMEYMPYLDSLTENTVRGNLYVPVIGSGTSNTEFEFLTGASTSFFPAGSNAYMLYVKNTMPSLVSALQGQGYYARAFHPYYASGWNRLAVYDYFGFSRFTSLGSIVPNDILRQYSESGADAELLQQLVEEAFPGENTLLRRYVSDERNYKEVIELYERRDPAQPFFLFNVTMQNHGGYEEKVSNFTEEVWVTELPNGQTVAPDAFPKTNQFLSLMKKSDEAFETLIRYFEDVEEPTVICMFGDHQPNVETDYIRHLLGVDSIYDMSIEQEQQRYVTPFYIWANYDIEEKEIQRLSVNYLSSYVMDVAGAEMPAFNRYLLKLSETVPVVNNVGIIDTEGNHYAVDGASPYTALMNDYKKVVYNYIHDENNRKDALFGVN